MTLRAICSEAGGLDFTEGFKRYLHFEASFPSSCFFFFLLILGLWEIFHLSSSPEINLSLEVFLTTEEDLGPLLDEFAKVGGTEKEEEKKSWSELRNKSLCESSKQKVQEVRGDRQEALKLEVTP